MAAALVDRALRWDRDSFSKVFKANTLLVALSIVV